MVNNTTISIKEYSKKNGEQFYMFKVHLGVDPLTGKDQYINRRGFKTKSEANLALAQLKLEISHAN